ncbi:MAG: hypothetical protein A2007_00440 [Verrucomicrobia bacterium GWC2_42_7]|nr:MAG: hypothetical protein A2007_00440 [Verrucomicrobia bacterium GWC2_42_7]
MKIVVIGGGEVGIYVGSRLSEDGHDVTLIEQNESLAESFRDLYNIRLLVGNGCSAGVLMKAEIDTCDYLLAMTNDDRVNIMACSIAKSLGVGSAVARVHDHTYFDHSMFNYQVHFSIDSLINPEALCAVEMAKSIRNPGRVAVENFARGQLEVQSIKLGENSKFSNRTLADIKIEQGIRVVYIQRGDFYDVPNKDTILRRGDILTLVGSPESLMNVRLACNPECYMEHVNGVLWGGTETAIALIRLLSHSRFKLRILEPNLDICKQLSESFPQVTVINGSATSLRLLQEEQIEKADFFIACSKSDEENIMVYLQAKKLGAKKIFLATNRSDYEQVIEEMKSVIGVELAVSPRTATYNEIKRYISEDVCVELGSISDNAGKILQIRIGRESSCIGRFIRDIQWPKGSVVVALLRKYYTKVPTAEDKILEGDHIVIAVMKDKISELMRMF